MILCGEIRSREAEPEDLEAAGCSAATAQMVDDLMRGAAGQMRHLPCCVRGDEMEQTIVGKPHTYVIRNPLTETNCSRTYLAKDEDTKRKVFIKAIDVPQECRERRAVLEDAVREAQAMIQVGAETHRVPTVYEYFHDEHRR